MRKIPLNAPEFPVSKWRINFPNLRPKISFFFAFSSLFNLIFCIFFILSDFSLPCEATNSPLPMEFTPTPTSLEQRRLQQSSAIEFSTKPWDFRPKYSMETVIWGERNNEMYGSSVAIWNSFMMVGAYGDKSREVDAGAVYLYERHDINDEEDSWKMTSVLHPDDGLSGDQFGYSVSLNDYVAVVGAPKHDVTGEDSGAAYLYSRTNAQQHQHNHRRRNLNADPRNQLTLVMKLAHPYLNDQYTHYYYFGCSVAVHVNTTAVGAWNCQNDEGQLTGCVFLWRRSQTKIYDGPRGEFHWESEWNYAQRLIPTDSNINMMFGTSVSVYGNVVAVGAPGCQQQDSQSSEGCVFTFETLSSSASDSSSNEWFQTSRLHPPNGNHLDRFGTSLRVWKRNLLVGSPSHSLSDSESGEVWEAGTVYSYFHDQWGKWDLIQQIRPHRPLPQGHFGYSLDVYETVAAIGAYNSAIDGSGSVDIFREHLGGAISALEEDEGEGEEEEEEGAEHLSVEDIYWEYHTSRSPENEIPGDMYGYAVSVYYSTVAVGAYGASLTWEQGGNGAGGGGPPDRRQGIYMSGGVYLYSGHHESQQYEFLNVNFEQNILFTSVLFILIAGTVVFLTVAALSSLGCISDDPNLKKNGINLHKPRNPNEWNSAHGLMQSGHDSSSGHGSLGMASYHDQHSGGQERNYPNNQPKGIELSERERMSSSLERGEMNLVININQ